MTITKFDLIDSLLSDSTFKISKKILSANRKYKLNLNEKNILNVMLERYNKLGENRPNIKLYNDDGTPLVKLENNTVSNFEIDNDSIKSILLTKKNCKWYYSRKLKEYIRYTPGYSSTSALIPTEDYTNGFDAGWNVGYPLGLSNLPPSQNVINNSQYNYGYNFGNEYGYEFGNYCFKNNITLSSSQANSEMDEECQESYNYLISFGSSTSPTDESGDE